MSVYLQSWVTRVLPLVLWVALFFSASGYLLLAFVVSALLVLVWPRCPSCKLPTFWKKSPTDPDHFIYYRPSPFPAQECRRCGVNLL